MIIWIKRYSNTNKLFRLLSAFAIGKLKSNSGDELDITQTYP